MGEQRKEKGRHSGVGEEKKLRSEDEGKLEGCAESTGQGRRGTKRLKVDGRPRS